VRPLGSPGQDDLLVAHGLSVCRGTSVVVSDASLSVQAGEWLAIVGPNGAGKSSLLMTLAGLWPAAAGSVSLRGQPLSRWSPSERARHIAWMGQALPDDEALSVAEAVALGRMPYQGWWGWPSPSAADQRATEQALCDADLQALRDRPLRALSGGERQRAHLARALATQAPVLLLDEPSAHLDAPHQRLLAGVLRTQAERGQAVVSVLHELPLAMAADRIAVMQSGRLLACGAAGDALVHRAIEAVFAQAVRIVPIDGRWAVLPCY
jgi:iron complex transport system ATP-binding protein